MTLQEIVAYIEDQFPSKEGQPTSVSQTGEDYACLCSSGVTEEGEITTLYPSDLQALAAYKASFDEYAGGRNGTLYWRILPELKELPNKGWYVYSRLLITDKEELPEGHELLLETHQNKQPNADKFDWTEQVDKEEAKKMAIWYCRHIGLEPFAAVFCVEPVRVSRSLPTCYYMPAMAMRVPLWTRFITEGRALAHAAAGNINTQHIS